MAIELSANCSETGYRTQASASVMLIAPGLTPVSATLGALGVVAPALVWFVQPLLSARTHRRRSCESEDYFWNFGPGG